MIEEFEQIKKRVTEDNLKSLKINRIPDNTKAKFIKWCMEEFEGDYGIGMEVRKDWKDWKERLADWTYNRDAYESE